MSSRPLPLVFQTTILTNILLLLWYSSSVWRVSASPFLPRVTGLGFVAVDVDTRAVVDVGALEEGPVPAPTTTDPPSLRVLRRRQDVDAAASDLTYEPNVCGFVSGSIGAAITCKEADRTCMPVGTWLRCCPNTATECAGPIPTACVAFDAGGSTGCEGMGESTTCCSQSTRAFCESLVMTSAGTSVFNVVCAGRNRGTDLIPLLQSATDDPRLGSATTNTPATEPFSSSTPDDNNDDGGDMDGVATPSTETMTTSDEAEETTAIAAPITTTGDTSVGAITGGVLGGVAGVSLLIFAFWFMRRRAANNTLASTRRPSTGANSGSALGKGRSHSAGGQSNEPAFPATVQVGEKGPTPAYLAPQTLPDLPPEQLGAPALEPPGMLLMDAPPGSSGQQSTRFYYGGMPKAMENPESWGYGMSPERATFVMGKRVG